MTVAHPAPMSASAMTFGRNLHEDLLAVTTRQAAMNEHAEPRRILHGRQENNTIHDEIGMRHFYDE